MDYMYSVPTDEDIEPENLTDKAEGRARRVDFTSPALLAPGVEQTPLASARAVNF